MLIIVLCILCQLINGHDFIFVRLFLFFGWGRFTVMYFQSNPGGITIFGWAVDRTLINTIFFIELSLVLFVLGKTIAFAKWSAAVPLHSWSEKLGSYAPKHSSHVTDVMPALVCMLRPSNSWRLQVTLKHNRHLHSSEAEACGHLLPSVEIRWNRLSYTYDMVIYMLIKIINLALHNLYMSAPSLTASKIFCSGCSRKLEDFASSPCTITNQLSCKLKFIVIVVPFWIY